MNQIEQKLKELPSASINNARSIFLNDFRNAKGNRSKEYFFAQKWGLDYDYTPGKDDGEPPANYNQEK